jgi:FkbH-like protein
MYALTEAQLHQLGRAFARARDAGRAGDALTPVRVAVLSNGTTAHLGPALVASALRYGLDLSLRAVSYDAAQLTLLGGDPALAAWHPEIVLLAFDYWTLSLTEPVGDPEAAAVEVERATSQVQTWCNAARAHLGGLCVMQTMAMPPQPRFGHADGRIVGTMARTLGAVNDACHAHADAVLDIATVAATVGAAAWFDARRWHEAKVPFAMQWVPLYADQVGRLLGALRGRSRRVLVTDLDNTLWRGVVGDDGPDGLIFGNGTAAGEAHLALQRALVALRARGIILAVSSKNDDEMARRAFRERPEMPLREEAFAAFRANWNDKAANIQAISNELALGLDSMVFLDDNPAERELVRRVLPDVAVPEVGEDPSELLDALMAGGWFESVTFSEEDRRRADLYRNRHAFAQVATTDLRGYLASLEMQLTVAPITPTNRARTTQLINKSNQFNLTTRRYTEAEVAALEGDAEHPALVLHLRDRLDDHGIISIILGTVSNDTWIIDLWVMSCRVIGRGVERAALAALVADARARGCTAVRGTYIPTARNAMVAEHYATLGFTCVNTSATGTTVWTLACADWHDQDPPPITRVER